MAVPFNPPAQRPANTVAIRVQAIREAVKNRPEGYLEEIDALKHAHSDQDWWYIDAGDYERLRKKYRAE